MRLSFQSSPHFEANIIENCTIAEELDSCFEPTFITKCSYFFLSELIFQLHQLQPLSQVFRYYPIGIMIAAFMERHLLNYYFLVNYRQTRTLVLCVIKNTSA